MPRYYFDVYDGDDIADLVGMHLPSIEAARREAYSIIARYASNPINLLLDGIIVVVVRNGPESVVMTLRMVCQEETVNADRRSAA